MKDDMRSMRNNIFITILTFFMLSLGIACIFVDCCHGPLTPNLNRYSTDFSWSNLHVSAIIMIEICAYIFLYPWFRYFRNFNSGFSLSDIFPVEKFIEDLFSLGNSRKHKKSLIIIATFNILCIILLAAYVFLYSYKYTTPPNSILVIARYPIPVELLTYPLIIWIPLDLWIYYSDRFNDNKKSIKSGSIFKYLILGLLLCGLVDLLCSSYDVLKQIHNPRIRHVIPDNTRPPIKETIQDSLMISNDTVYVSAFINLLGGDAQYQKLQLLQVEQLLSTEDKVISGCDYYQEVIYKLMENNWKDVVDDDTNTITCYHQYYTIDQIKSLPGLSTYTLNKVDEWGDGQTGYISMSEDRVTYIDSTLQKIRLEDIVIKEKIDDVLSIAKDHILIMCSEGRGSIAHGWTEDNPLLYDKEYLSKIACFTQKGILFFDTMLPTSTSVHLLLPYGEIIDCIDTAFTQVIIAV